MSRELGSHLGPIGSLGCTSAGDLQEGMPLRMKDNVIPRPCRASGLDVSSSTSNVVSCGQSSSVNDAASGVHLLQCNRTGLHSEWPVGCSRSSPGNNLVVRSLAWTANLKDADHETSLRAKPEPLAFEALPCRIEGLAHLAPSQTTSPKVMRQHTSPVGNSMTEEDVPASFHLHQRRWTSDGDSSGTSTASPSTTAHLTAHHNSAEFEPLPLPKPPVPRQSQRPGLQSPSRVARR